MINISTLERCIRRFQRLGALTSATLLLALSPYAASDEKSEEASAHILRAEMALQEHDYQAASIEYRKAAELSDDSDVAQQATRVAYSYAFNKEGLRSAQRWATLDKDSDEAMLYVAQLNLRVGEIRESRRTFEKLLKRGDEPIDERLLALIPFLSQEDPDQS